MWLGSFAVTEGLHIPFSLGSELVNGLIFLGAGGAIGYFGWFVLFQLFYILWF